MHMNLARGYKPNGSNSGQLGLFDEALECRSEVRGSAWSESVKLLVIS